MNNVGELMEGTLFTTRLTGKSGIVRGHDEDGGVRVVIDDNFRVLHPNVIVDDYDWEREVD